MNWAGTIIFVLKGDLMRKKHSRASQLSIQNSTPSGQEIDYSPRTYTLREKLIYGMKLFIFFGIGMLLLWLVNR